MPSGNVISFADYERNSTLTVMVDTEFDGDDGGNGGDMWQQTVETRLSELRADIQGLRTEVSSEFKGVRDRQETDFRVLFAALITSVLGLAGLLAAGFKWIG